MSSVGGRCPTSNWWIACLVTPTRSPSSCIAKPRNVRPSRRRFGSNGPLVIFLLRSIRAQRYGGRRQRDAGARGLGRIEGGDERNNAIVRYFVEAVGIAVGRQAEQHDARDVAGHAGLDGDAP